MFVYIDAITKHTHKYNLITDHNNLIINKIYTLCIRNILYTSVSEINLRWSLFTNKVKHLVHLKQRTNKTECSHQSLCDLLFYPKKKRFLFKKIIKNNLNLVTSKDGTLSVLEGTLALQKEREWLCLVGTPLNKIHCTIHLVENMLICFSVLIYHS